MVARYLSSGEFARIAGISERKARQALSNVSTGKAWRGSVPTVRLVEGPGGRSGKRYEVALDTLPDELQAKALEVLPDGPTQGDLFEPGDEEEAQWRLEIIQKALQSPKKSGKRAEAIKRAASLVRTKPDGSRAQIPERTIREWVKKYEQRGFTGLCRARRKDAGKRRVTISRKWDDAVPFDEVLKASILKQLIEYRRRYWLSNHASGRGDAAYRMTEELMELTRKNGFDPGAQRLRKICKVTDYFANQDRTLRAAAIFAADRKAFHDDLLPRVQRSYEKYRPMELIFCDVHHLDILSEELGGRTYTAKVIAWKDAATKRVFKTLYAPPPGQAVRQEHVIDSFVEMVTHPEWGMPENIYIDNGGEYGWCGNALFEALQIVASIRAQELHRSSRPPRFPVIKALPYNAPAKPVEGFFGLWEKMLADTVQGWIGGDRMKKKTASVGQTPATFQGGLDELDSALEAVLRDYHNRPQAGHLNGDSPNERFQRHLEDGWSRIDVKPHELRMHLARPITPKFRKGGFWYKKTFYTSRALQSTLPGTKIVVRVPISSDTSELYVFDDERRYIGAAYPDVAYDALDPAGAIESSRRKAAAIRAVRQAGRDLPRLDNLEDTRRRNARRENLPTPPVAAVLGVDYQTARAAADAAQPRPDREARELEAKRQRDQAEDDVRARILENRRRKRLGTDGV